MFTEIEYKYQVPDLKLTTFHETARALKHTSYVEASGYDYYFTCPEDADDFVRYRAGDRQELTTKKKTNIANNYVRDEYNLMIGKGQTLERIAGFLDSIGYPRMNFCIFKACFIYYYDTYDLVFYIVYDQDMREMNRFLEIEMLEEYPWPNEESARLALNTIEATLEHLGAAPGRRESKSLFERYRKV